MKQILSLITLALVLVSLSSLLTRTASAAPMPGTATSKLVSPQLGIFRSPLGFEIGTGSSGWVHLGTPSDKKHVATIYRDPKNSAQLTVRVDKLDRELAIDKYVQKWLKEYPKYGFEVLNSRAFSENKQKGYFLDLKNNDNGKQLRQVVFLKQKTAVILTCRDGIATFKESLKGCNQIIRTFSWN